ncbi:MAG TPA: Nramp family divalent metal transporter, partial [Vicinamibacteria bacterium]|nr:Nramp family divalent metal transporter [Vicinamibacteria bacterium]
MKVFGQEVESQGVVPEPLPLRRFMVYVGPVMMSVALGLGTSELILYPRLTAEFGTGWVGLMLASLVFQTVWAQELARWTVLCGEHGARHNARIVSRAGALVAITFFMFVAFAIPAWASVAATAVLELTGWPKGKEVGTVFWACVSFLLVFLAVAVSRVARTWLERMATWATLAAWSLLILAAVTTIEPASVRRIGAHFVSWDIPDNMDWWILGSTLAWVGAGPTLLWYTYWMKDAGWGMAQSFGAIPGGLGRAVKIRSEGLFPEFTPDNVARLREWIRRSNLVLWGAYFLGSLLTILVIVGLSDSILRPQGLIPQGFDVIRHQALFFKAALGDVGVELFLVMAWLFFFNNQMAISEAVVRQNADATATLLGRQDIKGVYLAWWAVYLVISFVLIALQYFVPGANPFSFVTYSAMLSLVSLLVSVLATLVGTVALYGEFPPALRPRRLSTVVLAVGFVFYLYCSVRAVASRFGL